MMRTYLICKNHAKRHFAFTLIEILVVLAVIGLAMMAVMPRIGETVARGDAQRAFFDALLQEHLVFALEEGAPVTITGFRGSGNILKHDGSRSNIPGVKDVKVAYINTNRIEGREYAITVYPDGLCDYFILEADDGNIFESSPLLMTVKRRKQ